MDRVFIAVGRMLREDRGQDLLEYGLLVVLITIAAMVVVGTLGNVVNTRLWLPIVQNI